MIKVQCFPLGELQANCYLLVKEQKCCVIDPADSADFILSKIQKENLRLKMMLATHGHFDHIMAAGEIQISQPATPLYIHQSDQFLLDRMDQTAKYFLGYDPVIVPVKHVDYLPENELKITDYQIKVISTPGHTPGSVCYYLPSEKILFSGDLIFKEGVGRYDFSYSNKKQLFDSIDRLIESTPQETIIYPGHGKKTTVKELKNYWVKSHFS